MRQQILGSKITLYGDKLTENPSSNSVDRYRNDFTRLVSDDFASRDIRKVETGGAGDGTSYLFFEGESEEQKDDYYSIWYGVEPV